MLVYASMSTSITNGQYRYLVPIDATPAPADAECKQAADRESSRQPFHQNTDRKTNLLDLLHS